MNPEAVKRSDHLRFWAKVDRRGEDECWEWTASRSPKGYGKFQSRGAHAVSYEIANGAIPAGLQIDHLCRNTSCVNPAHLEAVTPLENRRRRAAAQTHCLHGHQLIGRNVRFENRGGGNWRVCRTCIREASARYKKRNRP